MPGQSQAVVVTNTIHYASFVMQAPFCVHPKTGKLCVPIEVHRAHEFNPDNVPTLPDLVAFLEDRGNQVLTSPLSMPTVSESFMLWTVFSPLLLVQVMTSALNAQFQSILENFEKVFLGPLERESIQVLLSSAREYDEQTLQW